LSRADVSAPIVKDRDTRANTPIYRPWMRVEGATMPVARIRGR